MEAINDDQDLLITCSMPSIEVGTVGGGTSAFLPFFFASRARRLTPATRSPPTARRDARPPRRSGSPPDKPGRERPATRKDHLRVRDGRRTFAHGGALDGNARQVALVAQPEPCVLSPCFLCSGGGELTRKRATEAGTPAISSVSLPTTPAAGPTGVSRQFPGFTLSRSTPLSPP